MDTEQLVKRINYEFSYMIFVVDLLVDGSLRNEDGRNIMIASSKRLDKSVRELPDE